MRAAAEIGMPVILKMDENSKKMPHRMVITEILPNDRVKVAGLTANFEVQEGVLPTAALEKYNKTRYEDGI